ncbi:AraC family transcriptional regulator [Curtobacterium sp. MCSS17_015]|uniref:AraC family transcriptional regulator n=1 Tax=Curtobacterium sp. MCSS17_015 TaxID=2175666 RepID=UPI0011B37B6B|nr:AraC family transcriptional regulator [Curtobacterium sp. MCSS17_015]WIB26678.1 helix-turn-helix transcriptional regulator [Curtobacterium sp. MCSS17_015]
MTHLRPEPGTPDGFRAVRLEGTSETRPAVLDDTYGTGGGIGDERSAFRYTGAGDADLSLSGSAVEGRRTGTMEPRPTHILFWIGDGTAVIVDEDGTRTVVRPGQPFLLAATVRYGFEAATSRVSMLHLSDRLLRAALAADGAQVVGPLRFRRTVSATELADLRRVLQSLGRTITDPDVTGRQRAELNLRVARVVVGTFPVDVPATTSSERLRDALTYIQEHAHTVVTLADIAAAAGMSARGLQQSFNRSVGVSPLSHLRNVRLDAVHEELLGADPLSSSVAEVARQWGFAHLGRFSGAYRERFGELPSATLRGGGSASSGSDDGAGSADA